MSKQSYFKEKFTAKNAAQISPKAEFEACEFLCINWAEADLSIAKFIECVFTECNLSNARLQNTSFQDCIFKNCKLLGLHFDYCNSFNFSVHIENSQVDHSSFYQLKLNKSGFKACKMQEADFVDADLSKSELTDCDLLNAQFENTNLEGCSLVGSFNFNIHPEINRIKGAHFSANQLGGLLAHYALKIEP